MAIDLISQKHLQRVKRIRFEFESTMYDCLLKIRDDNGIREFCYPLVSQQNECGYFLETDICGDSFDVILTPIVIDLQKQLNQSFPPADWKEQLLEKIATKALGVLNDLLLRVKCKYHIDKFEEHEIFHVRQFGYIHGNTVSANVFELLPILYIYYELQSGTHFWEPVDVESQNRREIIRATRKISLLNFGLDCLFMYPIQVHRIKVLTKNKKVLKILKKFYRLTPEKRQQKMDKWDKL